MSLKMLIPGLAALVTLAINTTAQTPGGSGGASTAGVTLPQVTIGALIVFGIWIGSFWSEHRKMKEEVRELQRKLDHLTRWDGRDRRQSREG